MSTKKAIIAIVVLLLLCIGLYLWILVLKAESNVAIIYSNGQLIKALPLSKDTSFIVESSKGGSNSIIVKDGKICVSDATCPDHICVSFGWCSSGMPIVCLPNELIIEFPNGESYDGISG